MPVNELGGAMTRHPAHEQVAQPAGQATSGGLAGRLLDNFLDPERHWVVSTQSTHYRNSRTEVETLLRQRMKGPEERELPAALRGRAAERLRGQPLCVPRQLAELLQLSVEKVCADFNAMLRHD